MLDRRDEVGAQLTRLIADTFHVDAVALWDAREMRMDKAGKGAIPDDEVRATYFRELSENDPGSRTFKRVLRLGTRPVGAIYIASPSPGTCLDSRSVDAIASLSAMALERAHSFAAESNAEAAKRSEQLRSTVLDGLAYALKRPWQRYRVQARDCWKSVVLNIQRESSCHSSINRRRVWLS
jgi:two-component system, OmpR family, sensor histidine kinase KdpD